MEKKEEEDAIEGKGKKRIDSILLEHPTLSFSFLSLFCLFLFLARETMQITGFVAIDQSDTQIQDQDQGQHHV